MIETTSTADVEGVASQLVAYCRARDWAGHDPYDALNSRLFAAFPALNNRIVRLVFTQALKRSPIDVRPLLRVPHTQNPKALALFLAAFLKLEPAGIVARKDIEYMIDRLIALRSRGESDWCWGYSFPWQTRTVVVPAGAPNLVCTTFVADALLDAYDRSADARLLSMAASAARYIVDRLYWTHGRSTAGFSYPLPSVRVQIHNANLLAAALLCRVARYTGDSSLREPALAAARCSAAAQREDGSWAYGEVPSQQWVDNFHTGYNLCALASIGRSLRTSEFDSRLRHGLAFYRSSFFREDGAPRYFHDRTYPIDAHCVAQSIITLLQLKHLDPGHVPLANDVLRFAIDRMWDPRGFFYYRVLRSCTIRTSYMRWTQAWMLLAISTLLEQARAVTTPLPFPATNVVAEAFEPDAEEFVLWHAC
jgi:hypothetical protein